MSELEGGVDINRVADALRESAPRFFGNGPPQAHVVLGSGLSALADQVQDAEVVAFADLPGFPSAGVQGHAGLFSMGLLGGCRVMAQAGRFHMYEGHNTDLIVAPVRIGAALGSSTLVLTNAAGGIRRELEPGSAMLIDDHINLMWGSPLAGQVRAGEERFPDMSQPYDRELQALAAKVALATGVPLHRGVYAGVLGPSFETPAEIRMLQSLGADAVGMSTVPEAIVAAALGMRVVGFSMISNRAAGLGPPLSHAEVMEVGRTSGGHLRRVIEGVLSELA